MLIYMSVKSLNLSPLTTLKTPSQLPSLNPLVLSLFYTLRDASDNPFVDTLDFQVQDPSGEYNGITITSLSDALFAPITNTSVVFVGHRVPNTVTAPFVKKIYSERFTVTDADGHEFSAAKVYEDASDGFETTVPFVRYVILYATGKYLGRRFATIVFDNDGTSFGNGRLFARRIDLR